MAQLPPYSADRFPMDFTVSLLFGAIVAVVTGPVIWYLSVRYLQRAYPGHTELLPAAIVAGCLDGALIGLAGFVATFVIRIWRYEREERKRSDRLLQLALRDIHGEDR